MTFRALFLCLEISLYSVSEGLQRATNKKKRGIIKMNEKRNNLQKLGGVSALYGAVAFLTAIIFFLFIVDYPSITNQLGEHSPT